MHPSRSALFYLLVQKPLTQQGCQFLVGIPNLIAKFRGVSESEVFERALERRLEELWEDFVLAQYLDVEIHREEAIERVGRAKVKRAERELEIVEEDIEWGLNA